MSRKVPHKLTKVNSVKEKKELDLFQHPPHRRYFCHACQNIVIICLECDHRNKYCPICKKESKHKSNKKANAKYRLTLKGKKTRAACENRRREILRKKLNNPESCKIMGETSTNMSKDLRNVKNGAEVAPEKTNIDFEKGENDVSVCKTQVDRVDTLGFSPKRGDSKAILCSYCSKECSSLTYNNLLPKKFHKRRYWKIRSQYGSEGSKL